MSEQPKVQELQIMKENGELKLTIPTIMYHRLNQLLLHGIPYKDMEELGKVIDLIKKGDTSNHPLAYHTETLLIMINYMEIAAREQSLIGVAKINLETGKEIIEG